MGEFMKITVIGGDMRLRVAKKELEAKGFRVDTLGLFEGDNGDIKTSDILLLPVPTTKDMVNVFVPLTQRIVPLEWVENSIAHNQTVLCCNYTFKNGKCTDYNRLDSYAILNAVPTAEGAIKWAIEKTPFTLWGARVLVIGYGRVGKVLADRLKYLGAKVTVSARKSSDVALVTAFNMETAHTGKLNDGVFDYDIVFNTVDVPVLDNETLKKSPCKYFLDLSSLGGFNLEFARSVGKTADTAPALPGRTAPETAGRILAQTVTEIITSQE